MNYQNPTIPDILLISLVGFVTVFLVLVVLMGIIMAISALFSEKKKTVNMPQASPIPTTEKNTRVDSYTGVKLVGVSDREAALLMAIVADNLQKPLDNLRFISIKEVK